MGTLTHAASLGRSGTGGSLEVAPAGRQLSIRLLLLELLVVMLLYSSCHDFHVIMAVERKTRWTSTSAKESSQKEGLWLSGVVSAATGRPLVRGDGDLPGATALVAISPLMMPAARDLARD